MSDEQSATTLDTLHQDVLCLVLGHLNLRDLIAVAGSCRELRCAAAVVAAAKQVCI